MATLTSLTWPSDVSAGKWMTRSQPNRFTRSEGWTMSSKNVNSSSLPQKPAHGKWPISRVLTVFYTLSASAVLFLAAAFLYYAMNTSSEGEDRQSLADQVEV